MHRARQFKAYLPPTHVRWYVSLPVSIRAGMKKWENLWWQNGERGDDRFWRRVKSDLVAKRLKPGLLRKVAGCEMVKFRLLYKYSGAP